MVWTCLGILAEAKWRNSRCQLEEARQRVPTNLTNGSIGRCVVLFLPSITA